MDTNESVTIDAGLGERLREYARERGISIQEMFETALGLGLELCVAESGRIDRRMATLEKRVNSLFDLVHGMGPAVMGVRALLVAWAAREAFRTGEDELMAEIESTGRAEWDLALAERGLAASGVPSEPEGE